MPMQYRLYSTTGVVVRMGTLPSGKNESVSVDVQHLPKGIYIVEAQQGNHVVREKLRIE